MRSLLLPVAIAALTLASACSGDPDSGMEEVNCDLETRAETYTAGMSKAGAAGIEVVLVAAAPTPPDKGDNTWTVQVLDNAQVPMDDATLTVTPFMPDHGHGTSKTAAVTGSGSGMYDVDPVNLWMPGLWETTVEVETGTTSDAIVFSFCIEG